MKVIIKWNNTEREYERIREDYTFSTKGEIDAFFRGIDVGICYSENPEYYMENYEIVDDDGRVISSSSEPFGA